MKAVASKRFYGQTIKDLAIPKDLTLKNILEYSKNSRLFSKVKNYKKD